jgi:hypothetical protein
MRNFKEIIGIILFIMVAVVCASQASPDASFSVRRIFDGDTIELENGMHVRYIGINASE